MSQFTFFDSPSSSTAWFSCPSAVTAALIFSFLCFLCFLCFLSFLCFFSFFFFFFFPLPSTSEFYTQKKMFTIIVLCHNDLSWRHNLIVVVLDNKKKHQTLLGDWLTEPLLAFLTGGGGDGLAERDGEGDADAGAGRFWAAGCGETDLDLEDALLIGWGLGERLWRRHRRNQEHIQRVTIHGPKGSSIV